MTYNGIVILGLEQRKESI